MAFSVEALLFWSLERSSHVGDKLKQGRVYIIYMDTEVVSQLAPRWNFDAGISGAGKDRGGTHEAFELDARVQVGTLRRRH